MIYLAGPIFGRIDADCIGWRERATAALGEAAVINPMDRDCRGVEASEYKSIVEGDKAAIDKASAVLAFIDAPSVGTSMEILYAYDRKKPVVVVTPLARVSPWLQYHATAIVASLDSGIECVRKLARVPAEQDWT